MSSQQYVVGPGPAALTLIEFLAGRLSLSRHRAKQLLDARQVFVNGRRIWMARHLLRRADVVEVAFDQGSRRPAAAPAVLYQDAHVLIADKPAGQLAVGAASLEAQLRAQLASPALAAAHRLDRDTSGCLLLAKSRAVFDALVPLFQEQRVNKIYHAIVAGPMERGERTVRTPIDREPAVTHLRVLDTNRLAAHLALRIETGRTHQIRKHLLAIGHPVLGERAYGTGKAVRPEWRSVARQMLHARRLEFDSPFTGARIRAESPLPADFAACLRQFRLR